MQFGLGGFASLTMQTKKLKMTGSRMRRYSFLYSEARVLRTIPVINRIRVALFTGTRPRINLFTVFGRIMKKLSGQC
ncbi:hypothetical protein C5S39_07695 [Candidatus Methanophagaceae archaeon]|jgi:hypothetical protein|nr:hypothetical protein C5S39_07695 [Methanophagales archaeon]